jgi:hypothetical protein
MKLRVITFIVCLALSATASAFQPVEVGLEPLYDRSMAINGEQQLINQKLQAAETSARNRALAYRRYQVLEKERRQLTREIARSKELAQSPLITFTAPAIEAK